MLTSMNAKNGYQVKIDLGAQASTSDIFSFTAADLRSTPGVSTGLNSSPPTPELPGLAIELQRNAAYYQTSYPNGTAPGTATNDGMVGGAEGTSGAAQSLPITFPIEMRATPTISYWDCAGNASKASGWSNGLVGRTDNLALSPGPTIISSKNFWYGTNSLSTYSVAIQYTAYADFW